jgi:hypothetical protein
VNERLSLLMGFDYSAASTVFIRQPQPQKPLRADIHVCFCRPH